MVKVLNLIPEGDGCGWGVAGFNISKHIGKFCEVVGIQEKAQGVILIPEQARRTEEAYRDAVDYCDVILAPVANHNWGWATNQWLQQCASLKCKPVVGYGFHEFDIIGKQQIESLPKNFTALACGSTWMQAWINMALQGVADDFPLATVLQGVDHDLFNYQDVCKPDNLKDRFVIASAGKFEFRKAQDVVIEAFRRFKRSVPEAMLLMAWDNPWLDTCKSMNLSRYKHDVEIVSDGNCAFIAGVSHNLIAKEDQVSFRAYGQDGKPIWESIPNRMMPNFYRAADVALFPNRCEAGQAMPAVEAVACGVPSILMDAHGMEDLVDSVQSSACTFLEAGKRMKYPTEENPLGNWIEPCVEEIVSDLHFLHKQETQKAEKQHLSHLVGDWTWERTAKELVQLCERVA